MKALLLALFLCVSAHAIPNERRQALDLLQETTYRLTEPDPRGVFNICGQPDGLVPAAKALINRYFKTDMYNSTLFDKFLWLHPEHEDFISCVICKSGKPNDPYWERDFIRMCHERDDAFFLADEPSTNEAEPSAYL